eukprot:1492606-Rhodomonas_salina.4
MHRHLHQAAVRISSALSRSESQEAVARSALMLAVLFVNKGREPSGEGRGRAGGRAGCLTSWEKSMVTSGERLTG